MRPIRAQRVKGIQVEEDFVPIRVVKGRIEKLVLVEEEIPWGLFEERGVQGLTFARARPKNRRWRVCITQAISLVGHFVSGGVEVLD